MARLFPVVVIAAVIIPTAVLGGQAGPVRVVSVGSVGYVLGDGQVQPVFTALQVRRAFAAEGIRLGVVEGSVGTQDVELVGRVAPRTRLDVVVLRLRPGAGAGGGFSLKLRSGLGGPSRGRWVGSAFRGNVIVNWWTGPRCGEEAARVRAALGRLGLPAGESWPATASCHKLPLPVPQS